MSPRWARALLRRTVPLSHQVNVLGDLEEIYQQHVDRHGLFVAWWTTSFEAITVASAYQRLRWINKAENMKYPITLTELRLALRLLAKQPLLNLTAGVALAAGIALANTGFAMVDALVFQSLPYENGGRFIGLHPYERETGGGARLDAARFQSLISQATSTEYLGAWDQERFYLQHESGDLDQIYGALISPGAFRFLPGRPLVGRPLNHADGAVGALPVVLLGEQLWATHFGRSHTTLGSVVTIDGIDRTVVGIMPNEFQFPNRPLLWVPLDHLYFGAGSESGVIGEQLFGIIRGDQTLESAETELNGLSHQFESATGVAAVEIRVTPFVGESSASDLAGMSALITVAVLAVLIMAANVGNLIMVRTASRRTELAVRSALGASRSRIVGQLVVEVAMLVAVAAMIGFVTSKAILVWVEGKMHAVEGDAFGFWIHLTPSWRAVLFIAVVALLATVAAGLAPALRATRPDLSAALKTGGRGSTRTQLGRFGVAVTVLEMALSVALVGAAFVFGRGAYDFLSPVVDVNSEGILTASVWLDRPSRAPAVGAGWADTLLGKRTVALNSIRDLSGVRAVGAATRVPGQSSTKRLIELEPLANESTRTAQRASHVGVIPGYFDVLGSKPIVGRRFTEIDLVEGAPLVAVVNESFVRKFLHGQNALNRRFRFVTLDDGVRASQWREIVGVVPDLGMSLADPEFAAGFYTPMSPDQWVIQIVARVDGTILNRTGLLQAAVGRADPAIELRRLQTLGELISGQMIILSAIGAGLVLLGGISLLLSLVGVYAITSLTVAQRTSEIGLRVALGASPGNVVVAVSKPTMMRLAMGVSVGAAVGFVLVRIVYVSATGMPSTGPWEFAAVALSLGIAGGLACWIPTRRALRINAAESLQRE